MTDIMGDYGGLERGIDIDPEILVGKPIIKGIRLDVELIIDLLVKGWTEKEILDNYSGIPREDIRACLSNASETLKIEKVFTFSRCKK